MEAVSSVIKKTEEAMQLATRNSTHELMAIEARKRWLNTARGNQVLPKVNTWNTILYLAGRGFGKTRVGAEETWWYAWDNPETRSAVIAPTAADVRDTCFEGVSGILSCCPQGLVVAYNRSLAELILINGSRIKGFSADEPQRLRGPNHHRAWADELGAWRYATETMDQIAFGLRLGDDPKLLITTTPIPSPEIKQLVRDANEGPSVYLIKGTTFDNKAHLSARFLQTMKDKYENTRLGRQELYAEVLEDTPGALWKNELIDATRVLKCPKLKRIVIGIDPAVTANADSDETGIIVAGRGEDDHAYILGDYTMTQAPPIEWARKAIELYRMYEANLLVAEVNNGGDLVELSIRAAEGVDIREDKRVPVKPVRAAKSKVARAEPISILYERGIIHHVGRFSQLESQMTTFVPGAAKSSPDRLDALVWALFELFPDDESRTGTLGMIEVTKDNQGVQAPVETDDGEDYGNPFEVS